MQTDVKIQSFFDTRTSTVSYLVSDPDTSLAAVIDPVLDYTPSNGKISTTSADTLLDAARDAGLTIMWVLETHAHADHLSAAPYIRAHTGARIAIGKHICDVQALFRPVFNLDETDVSGDGSEFDHLFSEGDVFSIGNLKMTVWSTPGHTPACVSYLVDDAVFVGDTLFMPDYGTARADFPGGDAPMLYQSIRRILALPPHTRLFLCHDYKAPGRDAHAWETTVAEQRKHNVHIHDGVTEEAFVTMRNARDATLAAPALLLPSIQVNIRAGQLPRPESNNRRYLKIPLDMGSWIDQA